MGFDLHLLSNCPEKREVRKNTLYEKIVTRNHIISKSILILYESFDRSEKLLYTQKYKQKIKNADIFRSDLEGNDAHTSVIIVIQNNEVWKIMHVTLSSRNLD